MSLPNVKATFSMPLDVPPNGHSGKMSQPHWIPLGNYGDGCFVVADDSVLYVLDCDQNLILQRDAKLAFSGFVVDGKTIYVQDGYVLLRFDLEILQSHLLTRLKTGLRSEEDGVPQRAYNLITEERYSAAPKEGNLATIYNLKNAADKANADKLAVARRLRSWVRLIQDAQKERRKAQVRSLPARELLLTGMIDDARWLLGVDVLANDVSCEALFRGIDDKVRKIESDAARLRFSRPVIRQHRSLDARAVYVMDAEGLVMGFNPSLSQVQGVKNDPPIVLDILLEENPDRTATISYLTAAGITLLNIKDDTITKISTTATTISPASWVDSLALKRSQSPWGKTSLAEVEYTVQNVSTATSKNLLFVSLDEQNDTSTLQFVSELSAIPAVNGSNDFSVPAPNLQGGILLERKQDISFPIAAPVRILPERGIAFAYAVGYSSYSPTKLPEYIDKTPSNREGVTSGRTPPPRKTCRSMVWHKFKLQSEVRTEGWRTAWQTSAELTTVYQKSRTERDALQVKADQYLAQVHKNVPVTPIAEFTLQYYWWLAPYRDIDLTEANAKPHEKQSCEFMAMAFAIPVKTVWEIVANIRALALAEARCTAALPPLNEALTRAATAYSQSSLWNAWKQAGSQLLK